MAGIPSWMAVTGLTGAAMAVVSVLAIQAGGSPVKTPMAAPTTPPASTAKPSTPAAPPAVPANSGTGKRIVYSLSQERVWVIPPGGTPVSPGTVPAKVGTHYVTGHTASGPGTDGVSVEHIVFFEYTAETWVAFSAPVSDVVTKPD